jgi:Glycosyltransferase family 87
VRNPWLWTLAAMTALALIAGAQHRATLFAPLADWSGYRKDFTAFYTASVMVASGSGNAIYHTNAIAAYETQVAGHPVGDYQYMAYFNPPAFAVALTPLTFLSFERAYQVWTAFNVALLTLDVWLLWRISRPLAWRTKLVLSLGFLSLLPVVDGLLLGQFSLILLTAWMGAFLLLRSGHDAWAGASLAALLVKPEIVLPLLLILMMKRRWRVFAGFVPLALSAAILSVAVIGVAEAVRYPGYVLSSTSWSSNATKSDAMFNWNGIVAMIWPQPATVPVAALIVVLLSVSSLAIACYVWRGKWEPRSENFAFRWMMLTTVTVLVDPQLHLQDTVLLVVPAVALYAQATHRSRGMLGGIFGIGWAILAFGPIPNEKLHVDLFALYVVAVSAFIMARAPLASLRRDLVQSGRAARGPIASQEGATVTMS